MKILITGGSGFLGARLARALLTDGTLSLRGGPPRDIEQIILCDRASPPDDLASDPRITSLTGDLLGQLQHTALPLDTVDVVFHLAAAVSAECEADFDLGMRSNLDATRALLDACRVAGNRPSVLFASSVAVFGALPGASFAAPIVDDSLPTPQGSYGIQKFIGEQLVADYSRKGFIHGRSVRLMTVSVRPGKPNGAASGFLSGMVREPLAGIPAVVPVGPETAVALASPTKTIDALVRAVGVDDAQWGPLIAMNLPSVTTTVGDMARALERLGGPDAAGLLRWEPDANVQRLIGSWPSRFTTTRAAAIGLAADDDFDAIVRQYIDESAGALRPA